MSTLDVQRTIAVLRQAMNECEYAISSLERGDSKHAAFSVEDAQRCLATAKADLDKHGGA